MEDPATCMCTNRETGLLPPKDGRLTSRSAKPTLEGAVYKPPPAAVEVTFFVSLF